MKDILTTKISIILGQVMGLFGHCSGQYVYKCCFECNIWENISYVYWIIHNNCVITKLYTGFELSDSATHRQSYFCIVRILLMDVFKET